MTVYLIRHGEVNSGGEKRCLGHADLPLSEQGRCQAERLGIFFDGKDLAAVYTSPSSRTRCTADILSRGRWPVQVRKDLAEIDMGDWDGLCFSEIKERFPELYVRRGENPGTVVPPNAESPAQAQARAAGAFREIVSRNDGDVAAVAHAGLNRLLLCLYRGLALSEWLSLPQPYGCVNILRIGEEGITVEKNGVMPDTVPGKTECFRLLEKRGTPPAVVDHCRTVAKKADEIAAVLTGRGIAVDRAMVRAASLLHDIAKSCPRHAQAGAAWIRAEGYPAVADIIAEHEDLGEPANLNEAAVVYLADKLILGTAEAGLEERFARSREKCGDEAARTAHAKRFRQALWLREQIFGNENSRS
jgi:putative nucleotidyltransferase with HDIG domain